MVNVNKVIMSICGIMMLMCLCVGCSLSNKPSEETMKRVVIDLYKEWGDESGKFKTFKITKEFISSKNSRYCVELSYDLVVTCSYLVGDKVVPCTHEHNLKNIRFSFKKEGNQWVGWWGWGPGEEY